MDCHSLKVYHGHLEKAKISKSMEAATQLNFYIRNRDSDSILGKGKAGLLLDIFEAKEKYSYAVKSP